MFKRLLNSSGDIKKRWWARLVVIVALIGTDLFSAIVISKTAEAILGGSTEQLAMLLVWGLICLLLEIILMYLNRYLSVWLRETAMQAYKISVLNKYLSGKYAEVEGWRIGEALTRMQEDSGISANYLIDSIPSVVKLSARILIVGTFLCFINPWMLLTVVSFYPISIYFQSQISKPFGKKQENMMKADADEGALTQSILNQTKNIRAYNLVDYAVEKYDHAQEKSNKAYMSFVNFYMLQLPISSLAGIIPQILLYALGGFMVANGSMTIPVFLMFVTLAQPLTSFLVDSFQSIQGIRQNSVGVKRLFQIFDIPEEESTGKMLADEITEITVNDISFSYPTVEDATQNTAISNISFTIKSGEKIAIIGKSGSGKSTLAKLITGLYPPDSGNITINGTNSLELNVNSLRKNILLIPQVTMLIKGTAEENVAFYDSFSSEEIDQAMEKAAISALNGTDLRIENGNSTVSGGQGQRLGIARAYVRNPAVMIFDEPLSALDPDNAILLQENILALNNTVIEITHRLEKVQDFTRIFVMESGKLVEVGTYEQLMNAKGCFCDLIRKGVN